MRRETGAVERDRGAGSRGVGAWLDIGKEGLDGHPHRVGGVAIRAAHDERMHAREAEGHAVGPQAPQAAARVGARCGEHRPVRPVQAQLDRLIRSKACSVEGHARARLRGVVAHAGVGVEVEQEVLRHHRGAALVSNDDHLVNATGPIGNG